MDLAAAITAAANGDPNTVRLRVGQVQSVTASTVMVTFAEATISAIPYMASYTPTIGDVVMMLQTSTSVLVLGKLA